MPSRRDAGSRRRATVIGGEQALYCLFACLGVTLSVSSPPHGSSRSSASLGSGLRINADESGEATFVPRTTAALEGFNKSVPVYATGDLKHYMVDVQLGWRSNSSTPQVARLIIDTGSGDTVVFGKLHCDNKSRFFNHEARGGRGNTGCFDYRKSQSFKFNVEGLGRRINHACEYEKPGHQGAYCKEALLIDGYKAEVMCELAWEDVAFADDAESAPHQTIRTDICVVNDTETDNYKLRYWNNTQGTLGMFYHLCEPGQGETKCQTPYPSILSPNSLPETYDYMFTLDFNAPDKPSYMHFGAPATGWGDMSWSETQPVSLLGRSHSYSSRYAFHAFEIFDMRICGTDLLSNYSSHWTAMVDTGASCLSLPHEFFSMVESWVPGINCTQEYADGVDFTECANDEVPPVPCTNFKKLTICYLAEGVRASDLPVLSFRMGETGNKLYLPLEDLVVHDRPSGKPRVCLTPTDSYAMYRSDQIRDLLYFPKISFGTLALRNLVTSFDMKSMSVGMKNKKILDASQVLGSCSLSAVCVGAQESYSSLNTCIDPACHLLYFHELDEQTKTCRIGRGFLLSAICTLLALAMAEIALSEIYHTLARKLTASYATST